MRTYKINDSDKVNASVDRKVTVMMTFQKLVKL